MTFHRRCTLFFLDLFSILALIALIVEIIGPWMIKEGSSCYGIVLNCTKYPDQDKKYLTSLVTASTAGCLIAIMTVFAVLLSCGSCCDSPSCSRSMYRFALAYILLDVLALIANIVAMAMWAVMGKQNEFGPSFWVGWTANALLLIVLVILIILRTRGAKDEGYEDQKSQSSVDQPLFRSLYQMTPTTVFHDRH